MPIAITDEQRAAADAVTAWASRENPVAIARSQEGDPEAWRKIWPALAELGIFAAAVPESLGGAGGTLTDLAAMLESASAALVPGPVLSSALAVVLLCRAREPELLAPLLSGERTAAVALRAGTVVATTTADRVTLTGQVTGVCGASADSLIVVCTSGPGGADGPGEWFVVDATDAEVSVTAQQPADFSVPCGTLTLDGASARALPGVDAATVRDLAAALYSAEASGVGRWALRTATSYAKVREQFGRPIGSFQAIKHLCAQMLCRVEQTGAVAWDASSAAEEDPAQFAVAAAISAATALDMTVQTAKDCIQVLGGIGFTWEHDAHLYLRRAVSLRQQLGGGALWRRRVTELSLAGSRRTWTLDIGGPERVAVRAEAERIAALPAAQQRDALVDAGYLMPHWPVPYGLGAGAELQVVVDTELARVGITRPDVVIAGWALPTILQHGSPEQIERFVDETLRGRIVWCQLFSEPEAGSDLASLRTRAERVPGGWLLTGQKVWTSVAHRAQWGICLARTDSEAPKHNGISYFLVDMASPGIEIRPLREITGEQMFNEVFLDGVFVAEEMLVGVENDGWKLARTTLANERVAMGSGSSMGEAMENVLDLAKSRGMTGDSAVAERLGELITQGVVGSLLDFRTALAKVRGGSVDTTAASSVRKLVGVWHRQAVAEAGLDLLGADGAADSPELHQFLLSRCLSIAGGTEQVLLNVAAERLLGLPRD